MKYNSLITAAIPNCICTHSDTHPDSRKMKFQIDTTIISFYSIKLKLVKNPKNRSSRDKMRLLCQTNKMPSKINISLLGNVPQYKRGILNNVQNNSVKIGFIREQ